MTHVGSGRAVTTEDLRWRRWRWVLIWTTRMRPLLEVVANGGKSSEVEDDDIIRDTT
jgi:hypothetical protein